MNEWFKAGLMLLILVVLFVPSMVVLESVAIHQIYSHYVDSVSNLTGLNKYLVKAAVILMLIPFFIGIKLYFFSFHKKRKYLGATIIVIVLLLYNLGLYGVTKRSYFEFSEGKVLKWYANTPEGIRFFDSPGFDPKYGTELKPVTPEIIANLEKTKRGQQPNRLTFDSLDEMEFFDRITGETRVWYYKDSFGEYEFFDSSGIHPTYGETLKPVTREILLQITEKLENDEKQRQEQTERLALEEAKRDHDAYLNRYLLSGSLLNHPQSNEVAILVIERESSLVEEIDQEMASRLKSKGVNATASLFTGRFVSDGKFEKIFSGDADEIQKLELPKHCDQIVLGKSSVNFTQNLQMEDMISAKVTMEFRIISTKTGALEDRFTLSEVGVGFSRAAAKELAIERIAGSLETRILKTIT
jgi:hypothetical protein